MTEAADDTQRRAFSHWLRTGRVPPAIGPDGLELKFNPWHDPANGQFTFAGSGQPGAGGKQRSGAGNIGHAPKRLAPAAKAKTATLRRRTKAAAEFVGGVGEGLHDVAKDTVAGIRSTLTTNPVTTLRETTQGVAAMIDGALAAEDTPARVQIARAGHAIANASARDLGHATGTVVGNGALTVAPASALTRVSQARYLRKIGPRPTFKPIEIGWAKENLGKRNTDWRRYNDAADGARPGEAPTLMRTMPDGSKRPVKFDGIRADYVIDRKWEVVGKPNARAQVLRQAQALTENGQIGVWEVPTPLQKTKALKLLRKLNVTNIKVRIVKP